MGADEMVDDGVQLPGVVGSQGWREPLVLQGGVVGASMVAVGETQPGGLQSIVIGMGEGPQDALCGPPVSCGGGGGSGEGVIDRYEAVIEELGVYRGDASQEGAFGAGLDDGSKATAGAVGMELRGGSFHGEGVAGVEPS